MQKLVALGRIETATEIFNPGNCLPDSWVEAEKQRLISLGAAEMREVQQEDVVASTSVAKLPEVDEDTKKFEALVTDGVATKEQVQAITSFWEIKSWEDFANLSEAELTQTKGIGKATATKILASLNKG